MNSAWAAFIKTGNPSTSSLTWEEWDKDQTNVMHFGSTVEMMKDKYSDLYKIFEEYYSKASF
jgi:carboxylesterase type B